jgi:hypothetical protein
MEEGAECAVTTQACQHCCCQQKEEEMRLAWLLEFHFQELKIEPREQKRSSKGVWSKGRPVALRRLVQELDAFPI